MFKHANTWFPGDSVVVRRERNGKVAASHNGIVKAVDPDTGNVKVQTEDGNLDWFNPGEVVKQ